MKVKILSLLLAFVCSVQLLKAQTATDDCAAQHTGSYSFHNASKNILKLHVSYCYKPAGSTAPGYKTTAIDFILKPGESKTIDNILASPGVRNNFIARKDVSAVITDEGDFGIEECKTKTHEVK